MSGQRITRKAFYDLGGFANSNLYRKADKRGVWRYYRTFDRGD